MHIVISDPHEFQPNLLDAYFLRVAQASEPLQVSLLTDLTDENGILLLSKTSPFNEVIAHACLNKKIQQDITKVFYSPKTLNWTDLHNDLLLAVQDDEFLSRLNENLDLNKLIDPLIRNLSADAEQHSVLSLSSLDKKSEISLNTETKANQFISDPDFLFRLSILKLTCKETYLRSLLCTWLSVLLAKEMRLSESDLRILFIASLAHDLGMLHVSSEILDSDDSLSSNDWLELQKHVIASEFIIRKNFQNSEQIALTIREHHERCDGTGYPDGKVESELSLTGEILGLSDSVIAIFRNRFDSKRHSWRDVIPIIQMNAQAYFFRHAEIIGNLWRKAEMPSKHLISADELQNFVDQLKHQHGRTLDWFNSLTKGVLSLGFTHGDRKLHAMQNVALHLATSTKGVGIFSDEFMEWLKNLGVQDYADHAADIQEAFVKLQEVISHLQKLTRMLKIFIEDQQTKDVNNQKKLQILLEEIKKILGVASNE